MFLPISNYSQQNSKFDQLLQLLKDQPFYKEVITSMYNTQPELFRSRYSRDVLDENKIFRNPLASATNKYKKGSYDCWFGNTDYYTTFLFQNGTWHPNRKTVYEYNNDWKTSNYYNYKWNEFEWTPSYWGNYQFDPVTGYYSEWNYYLWNVGTSAWDLTYKQTFEYDAYGNTTQSVFEYWTSSYYYSYKIINTYFMYNDIWYRQDSYRSVWDNLSSTYKNEIHEKYFYNDTYQNTEKVSYLFDSFTGEWNNWLRETYSYDASGNQNQIFIYTWSLDQWLYEELLEYLYELCDEYYYWMTRTSYNWSDGAWAYAGKYEYFKDEFCCDVEQWYSEYYESEWVPVYRYYYERFPNLNPQQINTYQQYWYKDSPFPQKTTAWKDSLKYEDVFLPTVGVESEFLLPVEFKLSNYPNPFNPLTNISFTLPESGPVTLKIYDIKGRLVKTLSDNSVFKKGEHNIIWDGTDDSNIFSASGVYIYRFESEKIKLSRKCILLK